MAPQVNWGKIDGFNVDDPDEEEADKLFDVLAEYDPDDEEEDDEVSPEKLRQLFLVTRTIMAMKDAQMQVAMDEMEKVAKTEGKTIAKKERELLDQIDELKDQVKTAKRYGSVGGDGGATGSNVMREELAELERLKEDHERQIKDLERDNSHLRSDSEKFERRAEDAEKDLREMRRECKQLRDDVLDYQKQLEQQRDTMLSKQHDAAFKDKMTKKNRELIDALEENERLASSNTVFESKCRELTAKLEDAVKQMDRTTDEYTKLKAVVQHSDAITDDLKQQNDVLKAQVSDLTAQIGAKGDMDDEIMSAVSQKVEEWKKMLAMKDDDIYELQCQVNELKGKLTATMVDTDKASVSVLKKAIQDRDKQIEVLRQQLDQATADLETNAAIIEDMQHELGRGGGGGATMSGTGPGDRQQTRLRELQGTLKAQDEQLREAIERMELAEKDAREKDQELNEALERNHQYEAGEYGLSEAVAEIKDWKQHVKVRDRQIEELTQHINKIEIKMNDLADECDALRDKCGLDPREPMDLTQFRINQGVRREKDRALCITLQQEVETLEEERIELKQRIRSLAQQQGQRAVALGLTSDDLLKVDAFTQDLRAKSRDRKQMNEGGHTGRDKEELKLKFQEASKELDDNVRSMDALRIQNGELKAKNKELEDMQRQLEQGVREVHQAIQEHAEKESKPGETYFLSCPTLERVLGALEARALAGQYESALPFKARADVLEGRCDELRTALREIRHEANKARLDADKAASKSTRLEEEVTTLREGGAGVSLLHTLGLPEHMTSSSAEVIASLNEHLVQVLQELTVKEEQAKKLEEALENYRRRFGVMRHQQGLLYKDHVTHRQTWEEAREKMEAEVRDARCKVDESQVKLQEFNRMMDTLDQSGDEIKRRVSETTRKVTMLRVNEKTLTRRYTALLESEGYLRKETHKMRNESVAMEAAVQERLGFLQRYKDMASFKMAVMQKTIDQHVPREDLEQVEKKYHELTERYRDLLEKGNTAVAQSEAYEAVKEEVGRLLTENEGLKKEMQIDKEKLHLMEQQLEAQGTHATSGDGSEGQYVSISQRLSTLELKELNERQRAEHAQRMYEQQRGVLRQLEDRNAELETKFAELTKMNLEAQKTERELRDELASCVTKAVSEADRRRIMKLEKVEVTLRSENDRLKEIAEIAQSQARAFELQQESREIEVKSLRQQLADIQAQSDEKTIIGKLHRQLVQLQVSEGTAVRKLEESRRKIKNLEAVIMRVEAKSTDKEATLYHAREEARHRARHLRRTIQELRLQFAGAVPLSRQERFSKAMSKLQEDKFKADLELKQLQDKKGQVEDKLAELELKHEGLQELTSTLKDGRGAEKVAEWHGRMEGLRLEEMKQKRSVSKLQKQTRYLEGIIRDHEATIASLEEDSVRLSREFEERQLQWEHREVEMERAVVALERQQEEIAGAAAKFEEAIGTMPDARLPVARQLEEAVSMIRANAKTIIEHRTKVDVYKKRVQDLEQELKTSERAVLQRDRLIAELRLRMPATSDRDTVIARATERAEMAVKAPEEDFQTKQAFRIAQSTIASLQSRVEQKEETIVKYQELLKQAREEMQTAHKTHEQELKLLQSKLHAQNDAALSKYREASLQATASKARPTPTNKQLARLNELEDVVAEQDNSLAAMSERLRATRTELENWKMKHDDALKGSAVGKDRLLEEAAAVEERHEKQTGEFRRELEDRAQEVKLLEQEVEKQKEENARAPSKAMKSLVDRLKQELAQKEKQQQKLSRALEELRADMVQQAEASVKAHTAETEGEINVQRLVEKRTRDLQEQLEEATGQVQRFRKDIKKVKDKSSTATAELEDVREDFHKKERLVDRLKGDKQRLEATVEDMEQKLERLKAARKPIEGEGRVQENQELRGRIRRLEDELRRARENRPEKPYDEPERRVKAQTTATAPPPVAHAPVVPATATLVSTRPEAKAASEATMKWEETKKLQKQIDRLKQYLRERDETIGRLEKNCDLTKRNFERSQRDRQTLEKRMSSLQQQPTPPSRPRRVDHTAEELKHHNFALEEEVAKLRRQVSRGRDAAFAEVEMRNQQLTERLEQLERALTARQTSTSDRGALEAAGEREDALQRKALEAAQDNMQLKFELEQARKDVPRLKERVEDLQNYVEVLKQEKLQLSTGSSLNSSGAVRRIGDSGKSQRELERTVALLKKVVERTQAENQALKRAPGVVSNETIHLVQQENQGLKQQLEDMRQQVGAGLSERYTTTQRGTAKVMAEHDKLRRQLIKEQERAEAATVEAAQLRRDLAGANKDLEATRTRLELDEARRPTTAALESQGSGWTSAVTTRVVEGRVKTLEDDLQRKNKLLSESKRQLRQAAEREQELDAQCQELARKVEALERLSGETRGMAEGEATQRFLQARLTIDRLENEKKELAHQIRSLRGMGDTQASEEVASRLASHEQLLRENVELRAANRGAERERNAATEECDKLRKELSNFGPEFFEEIEDLKFNYREAVQKVTKYERQLRQLSDQFGVSVSLS